jgi:hypothetical protein
MRKEALEIIKGGTVIPATPLALDENRNYDDAGQRLLMRYYLDSGVGATAPTTPMFPAAPHAPPPVPRCGRGPARGCG